MLQVSKSSHYSWQCHGQLSLLTPICTQCPPTTLSSVKPCGTWTATFSCWSQNGMTERVLAIVPMFMLTTWTVTLSFWSQNGMAVTALAIVLMFMLTIGTITFSFSCHNGMTETIPCHCSNLHVNNRNRHILLFVSEWHGRDNPY